jgi:hypothetical protein
MYEIERRAVLKGATAGALAFSVGGAEVLLTPRAARAQGVPLRTLSAAQAATLDALGETLVPGARQAGISHFVDQQISIPAEEALLEARILNVRLLTPISIAPRSVPWIAPATARQRAPLRAAESGLRAVRQRNSVISARSPRQSHHPRVTLAD